MMKILHCADLHLAADDDRAYGLSVLDGLVGMAIDEKARFLVFAGDTFDSFAAAGELRNDFRERMVRLADRCEPVLVAGNHEDLGRGGGKLSQFDLGIPAGNLVEGGDFAVLNRGEVEFLAVSHRARYEDYTDWDVPPRGSAFRIAVAHGTVEGMGFAGIDDDEDGGAVIDADLFVRNGVDYAAMGHLHAPRSARAGDSLIAYPGSARMWRRKPQEAGPRRALVLELGDGVAVRAKTIEAAGQYRIYPVPVGFDGSIPGMENESVEWGPADFIHLRLTGIVEDENRLSAAEDRFRSGYAARVRAIHLEREDISVAGGISGHAIARKFLARWSELEPKGGTPREYEIWRRARILGLAEIRKALERR